MSGAKLAGARFRGRASLLLQVKPWILSNRRARWCAGLVACAAVAAAAAIGNAKGLTLLPPGFKSQNLEVAGASTQVIVDEPAGNLVAREFQKVPFADLTLRALLLGELSSTRPVLADIAHRAGVAPGQLSGTTSYLAKLNEEEALPGLEERANQIINQRAPYHLDFEPDPTLPRIQIYARGPTVAEAENLGNAAVPGLRDYLRTFAAERGLNPAKEVKLKQAGPARGGVLNSTAKVEVVGLTFLVTFVLCLALLAIAPRVRRGWRMAAARRESNKTRGQGATAATTEQDVRRLHTSPREVSVSEPAATRVVAGTADDWPHTKRILPWMIAAFLVILWLFPFDLAQIGQSLPIDLKLDRVVLPLIILVWVLTMAVGGRAAPRVRVTAIHVGVFIFAAFAFLSVVISARYLNQTLGLALGVKRLALLASYVIFFVLIASVVRRSEIRAFLRYTLALAVLAAVGTIIEYRFNYNIFNQLAHTFLPGFHISAAVAGIDTATGGRRVVSGPADHPLEAVGMFTMALPIALVGILEARRWRPRLLYGLAGALLVAAVMSTERKSGLLGVLAVLVTLGFFRRRQLLPLAPLGLIMLLVVKFLTPGAIGSVTSQLAPSQLATGTVGDRVIRYDAIRPDVWLHLVFGQGYGTYTVRVLDNELLSRLVEGGVLGVSAYVLMLVTIVFMAAGPIRRRVPVAADMGLVAACAASSALVLSALYDFTAFPHGPYILLSLAGLLAVVVRPTKVSAVTADKRAPPVTEPAWSY